MRQCHAAALLVASVLFESHPAVCARHSQQCTLRDHISSVADLPDNQHNTDRYASHRVAHEVLALRRQISVIQKQCLSTEGVLRFNDALQIIEQYNFSTALWTPLGSQIATNDLKVDTVKFSVTPMELTNFDIVEKAFAVKSDFLPVRAVYSHAWAARMTGTTGAWRSITWASSPQMGRFVSVGGTGPTRVMYSDTGTTWTAATLRSELFHDWHSVTFAPNLNRLVVVGCSEGGGQVMTSDDLGSSWESSAVVPPNDWRSVVWAGTIARFVAVAGSGTPHRVMTSYDGRTWDVHGAVARNVWTSIAWSPELRLLVAVASAGDCYRVMISRNGTSWTPQLAAANNNWTSVIWGSEPGLFVAVSCSGAQGRIMTSYDGTSWVLRRSPALSSLSSVTWGGLPGLFVATSTQAPSILYSSDGITWYEGSSPANRSWSAVAWSERLGLFAAVSGDTAPTQSITSSFSTSGKYGGGCLSRNNKIYYIPSAAMSVLVYDPTTRTADTIDLDSAHLNAGISNKWIGGCITPTDLVVGAPFSATSVLTVNATINAVLLLPVPTHILNDTTSFNSYWNGCAVSPSNTFVYFAPGRSNRVLTLDYRTLEIGSIALPVGFHGVPGLKFNTVVLGADRNVYMFPRDLGRSDVSAVLKVDVHTNSIATLMVSFPPNEDGSITGLYFGAVLGPDRNIYVVPLRNRHLMEFDPATSSAVFHPLPVTPLISFGKPDPLGVPAPNNWVNAILGPNRKVYGIPFRAQVILEFNPVTKIATYIPLPSSERTMGPRFFGAVMGPNRNLYFVPRDANVIMEMAFDRSQSYENWFLSPYLNRC